MKNIVRVTVYHIAIPLDSKVEIKASVTTICHYACSASPSH